MPQPRKRCHVCSNLLIRGRCPACQITMRWIHEAHAQKNPQNDAQERDERESRMTYRTPQEDQ